MRQFPWVAQAYILGVIALGIVVLFFLWFQLSPPGELIATITIGALLVAAILADVLHIHLHYKVEFTMSLAVDYAVMLLFGPAIACWVGAVASAISDLIIRKPCWKLLFNASMTALSVGCSGLLYNLINDGANPLQSPLNAIALLAAGGGYLGCNTILLSTGIGLAERQNPIAVWRANFKGLLMQLATMIPLGTLVAVVYLQVPWGLVLLLLPILLANYSFEQFQELQTQTRHTIELLAQAVDRRDRYTYSHSQRVAYYSQKIAERLGLDLDTMETVVQAAKVHDLGKIGIDSRILLKNGPLTDEEWRIMKEHPTIGAEIVGQLSLYKEGKDLIAHHQERYDGLGYPDGLKGDSIALGARIIAVADTFDAMTTDRPYRKALSLSEARRRLIACKGSQLDARVVDALLEELDAQEAAEEELRQAAKAAEPLQAVAHDSA